MGRVIVLAASLGALSVGLAGCGSMSMPSMPSFGGGGSWFTPEPQQFVLQLDSRPAGAQATTSAGPGCRTPCTVQVPIAQGFSVTFTLDRHTPQTIPVEIVTEGVAELDDFGEPKRIMGDPKPSPNPVFAALEPARPARGKAPPPKRQQAAAPPKAAAKAARQENPTPFPPPPGNSAFPATR